ncbi:ABC transporter substrate-binding protein [Desulfovibrio sp. UCD-KL4C]|uniref:substrate-binding periplasmic protein n=1 Tax=Desulfovibrio sp. UCD-KL4C TaxID=2578120 RepID=UPI0025BE3C70|nr:transporter substrate-binding domain-containing protein [Desulfovibrio sp. UCD-KL4C]
MKKIVLFVMLLASILLMASAGSVLAEETIAFDEANAPFMYLNGDAVSGLYPVLVGEAFKRMNSDVKLECRPWNRVIAGADAGNWGVGGIYKNADRLKKYDYSEPIFEEKLMIFVTKGGEFNFSGVNDLTGKSVGVMRGWSYGDDFDKAVADGKVSKDEVENDKLNFTKLIAGRVDAAIASPETWSGLKAEMDPGGQVVMLPTPLAVNNTYLIFNKSADKKAVLAKFNQIIESMKADGTVEKIAVESFK